jgi:predicted transcriptional regulator
MTQSDILDYLKQQDDWLAAKEIEQNVDMSRSCINECLRRLRQHENVDYKQVRYAFRKGMSNSKKRTSGVRYIYRVKEGSRE